MALSKLPGLTHKQREIPHLATVVGDLLFARSTQLLIQGAQESGKNAANAMQIVLDGAERAGSAQFEEMVGFNDITDKGIFL